MADAGSAPKSSSNIYRYAAVAILLCGAIAAALIFREQRRAQERETESEFTRRATVRHALTREILGRYKESLFALSALFTSNSSLSHNEFARAAARLQQRLPGALAFEWVPYVTHEDRADVEATMLKLYRKRGFEFIDIDQNGHASRAPNRPFHYPICYIEPVRGNEIALGFDLVSGPTIQSLERARLTHQMVVTPEVKLVQETANQPGIIMICPVYQSDSRAPSPPFAHSIAEEGFVGFLQCVFRMYDLLDTVCATQPDATLDMLFVDASAPDQSHRTLYFRPGDGRTTRREIDEAEFKRDATFFANLELPQGARQWQILYRPRAEWLRSQQSLSPLWRASAVMALSAMLAGLVVIVGRQTETIRRQVAERTAELGESRRRFANFVHALPGLAYRGSYDNGFRILFASEGALALTGWTAEEILAGQVDVHDLLNAEDIVRVREETQAALQARRDIEVEYRLHARDGTEKWVLSRGRGVYDASGKVVAIEGIIIDITAARKAEADRLALERKLLETQKLESLGLLAGGIAHDFNNLLSAILGNASLARMSLESNSPVDPQLRAIETASLRAAELCRQMLAYAGKGRFVVERVDLSAVVEDLLPLLRVSIARSAVLHLDLAKSLPGVKADATQIRQIVMNLVLNAVDALSGRNGEITVRTSFRTLNRHTLANCVTGQTLPVGDYVVLEVSDTGCGMAPEVRAKIFDPFFTTKFAGRGLGLAAVLGIVRGHNGALEVESDVDRGSTFRLFLPAIVGETVQLIKPVEPARSQWHHTGDVLVIEDEEPVRIVTSQLLKTFGFDVETAVDGQSGIDRFCEDPQRWTLVILDLLMPGKNGEQTLAELRAARPDIRVLLVSGYAESDIVNRLESTGRLAFLAKPFEREAFEDALKPLFN